MTPRFSPQGPPGRSSPASSILSGRYDFLRFIPPHFVFLRLAVPRSHHFFTPRGPGCQSHRLGGLLVRLTRNAAYSVEITGSLTFLGNLSCAFALLSDPGRPSVPGLYGTPTRPPLRPRRGRLHCYFRGSITRLQHSLSTLRRMGRPTTTQDSLPAAGQALPDGIRTRKVPSKGFSVFSYITSSFPKLRDAKTHLVF